MGYPKTHEPVLSLRKWAMFNLLLCNLLIFVRGTQRISYPVWSITVPLPINLLVEYKYVRQSEDGDIEWESTPFNRRLATEGDSVNVDDGRFGDILPNRECIPELKRSIERRARSVSVHPILSTKQQTNKETTNEKVIIIDY